jgi:hypothetical protein
MIYPDVIAFEFALLDMLRANQRLKDWRVEFSSLPGFNRDEWEKLFLTMPAIGTYCAQAKYEKQDRASLNEVAPLAIICAGANYRRPGAPRVGDEHEPGAGHLVAACHWIISQWPTEGTNIKSITPQGWDLVWCNTKIAVCALIIQVTLTRPIKPTGPEVEAYGSSYE